MIVESENVVPPEEGDVNLSNSLALFLSNEQTAQNDMNLVKTLGAECFRYIKKLFEGVLELMVTYKMET